MNFIAPWYVPALAAALTVPPLVLLYFLKLKRRDLPVASTLLWQRFVQDLQVSQPFQKLRNNLLLILQLLILLAALLAISEPMWAGSRRIDKPMVLLIDHSASMAVREDDGLTRLDIARREAHKVIDDMNTDQRAMVIAFADRARVLTPFTDDKDALRRQLDGIEQSDSPGRLREAIELAEAHSTPAGEKEDIETQSVMSHYIVFTDGRLPDAGDVMVERGTLEIARVGRAANNVGIVNLQVRRNYERPEQLSVLVRVRNFGAEPAHRDVSLYINGELDNIQSLPELEPLGPADQLGRMDTSGIPPDGTTEDTTISEANISFELTLDSAAELEVRLPGRDALDTDDRAFAVATPPRPITALLVTPGNRFLTDLVEAFVGGILHHCDVWTPDEYEDPDKPLVEDGRCRYDVVILDGWSTDRLPPGNYLFFGAVPLIDGVDDRGPVTGQVLLDWDDTHPILRHVNIGTITVLSWLDLELPEQATTLVEGTNGPVLALLNRGRSQYLINAFGFLNEDRTELNTDWIRRPGIVAFMSNALRYLAGTSTIGQQPPVKPGEAFTVMADPGTNSVTLRRPDGSTEKLPVRGPGLVTVGGTDRVGVYHVGTGTPNEQVRAVSLLDDDESLIAPNEGFRIAAGELEVTDDTYRVNRPLWPYLLAALGVILLVEWCVYNRRVFI